MRDGRLCGSLLLLAWAIALASASQAAGQVVKHAPRPIGVATRARPGPIGGGFDLPNGWRITPAGARMADLNDLVLKLSPSPDGRVVAAVNSGYLPHGVSLIDARTHRLVQSIALKTTWLGAAWAADGRTLYVSGGNANGEKKETPSTAPIYALDYRHGRLVRDPAGDLVDPTLTKEQVWWAGLEFDARRNLLYAVNRGTSTDQPSAMVVFDAKTHVVVDRIPVGVTPYEVRLSADGRRLFVSNWADRTVSVIDAATRKPITTVPVGPNPNDMLATPDGRLFVVCSGDNSVAVIDTRTLRVIETLSTALHPGAPEGSTPDALAFDARRKLLFAANADNNDVAVIDVAERRHSEVEGFIPTGWYPSALAVAEGGRALYVGTSKGEAAYADPRGPGSPLASKRGGDESIKTLQRSTVERVSLTTLHRRLRPTPPAPTPTRPTPPSG